MKKIFLNGAIALCSVAFVAEIAAQVTVTRRTTRDTINVKVTTPSVRVVTPVETVKVVTVNTNGPVKVKKKKWKKKNSPGNSAFGHSRGKKKGHHK